MRNVPMSASLVLCLGLLAVLATGCKEGEPPTGLEAFIAHVDGLEGQARLDTLRSLAAGDGRYAVYAHYLIGNDFYGQADQKARGVGWEDQSVNADLDSAEAHFLACTQLDSTFLEAYVNLGSLWDDRAQAQSSRALRDRKLETAREYYERALAIDPTDEKALCNLGSLYLNQRKTADALATFQKVLELNPDSALAHYNLAIMFAETKIYREALVEFEAAAKADPGGDIGRRAHDNVKIIQDLMNAPDPSLN